MKGLTLPGWTILLFVSDKVLETKLRPPSLSSGLISRKRLLERLNQGMGGSVTLVSASAGFGKSTLLADWLVRRRGPAAWLSLEERDNDLATFLTRLVAALQKIEATIGEGLLSLLRSPQQPDLEALLTPLINEIASIPEGSLLVVDDLHLLDEPRLSEALAFLVEHLPSQLQLVIATREDPPLPLPRLRARGRLNELRNRDLRFSRAEAKAFFQASGLSLRDHEIDALEERTEGWVAGLQLAAISLQGESNREQFLRSFTGSHRFVLDYLVEEVLLRQPEEVQRFLLSTSVLDRLCGPLCDALLRLPEGTGQSTLEHLERSNLFLISLDSRRHWYRYHHLFADLLRRRLRQPSPPSPRVSGSAPRIDPRELHHRASVWYEEQGLLLDAFRHAAFSGERERTIRLAQGEGTPLHLQGGVSEVLGWLETIPESYLDERPELWVLYASALSTVARKDEVKEKLRRAEVAISRSEPGPHTDDLRGRIAAIRAMEAAGAYEIDTLLAHSRRALKLLAPDSLPPRISATWTLGFAHQITGDRQAAREAYTEAITLSRATGNLFMEILAATGLGIIEESELQLQAAEESFRGAVALVRERREPALCEAHLGLGRIAYQRNDLESAASQAGRGYELALKIPVVDTYVACTLLQAKVALAQGRLTEAEGLLREARKEATIREFREQLSEVAEAEARLLLSRGEAERAERHAKAHGLEEMEARALIGAGESARAVAILTALQRKAGETGPKDELLRLTVLEATARSVLGEEEVALDLLSQTLPVAERGGFLRLFLDEREPARNLLSRALDSDVPEVADATAYIKRVLAAFRESDGATLPRGDRGQLPEPLSRRELEILNLIAQGLSNEEIGERLYISLSTVKGHNQNIFAKLDVRRRTEAVARVRELGIL